MELSGSRDSEAIVETFVDKNKIREKVEKEIWKECSFFYKLRT